MTRSQLITKVANDTGLTATAVEKVMDGIFGTIGDVLRNGEKVTIAGFGRFGDARAPDQELHQPQDQGHEPACSPPPSRASRPAAA